MGKEECMSNLEIAMAVFDQLRGPVLGARLSATWL